VQGTGDNVGTWGDVLNNQAISYIDQNMGGVTSRSLSASNVTLSASESRNAILRLTGTLLANVVITTECIGFFFVDNACTGAFTVTVRNASVATAATVPQGSRVTVISDATNGCRSISAGFEAGVKSPFYMSTAPIGWTRDATAALNNAAIRIVTTGGAATGGAVDFTTALASQTPAGTVGGTAITTAQMPSHAHFAIGDNVATNAAQPPDTSLPLSRSGSYGTNEVSYNGGRGTGAATIGPTSSTGSGETHTHSFTGSAINLAVKYADFLVATRD
jgi:hypothetical protein